MNSSVTGGTGSAPDTMGVIGPDHFIQIVNYAIKVYRRDGTTDPNWGTSLNYFFGMDATHSALGGAVDPRVIYDPISQRWFASAMERNGTDGTVLGNNNVILAVSGGSNPVSQPGTSWIFGSWSRYRVPLAQSGKFLDFPTLGVDGNGVYIAANYFSSGGIYSNQRIAAIWKYALLNNSTLSYTIFDPGSSPNSLGAIQPVINLDSIGGTDPAWFVRTTQSTSRGVDYRYVTWNGSGVPSLNTGGWQTIVTPTYGGSPDKAYTPDLAPGTPAPQMDLFPVGDRLATATRRGGYVWTSHGILVSTSNGFKNGCEWLKFQVVASPNGLQLSDSGRVYDTSAAAPLDAMSYYFPSVTANSRGDAIMGFSGSSKTQKISSHFAGRLSTDSSGTMSVTSVLHAGEWTFSKNSAYSYSIFGDYSATSADPKNPGIFWTIQAYATSAGCTDTSCRNWGVWVNAISP